MIAGSNPATISNASVAQQVERWPEEPSVTSSILVGGTIFPLHLTGRMPVFEAENGSSSLSAEAIFRGIV